MKEEWWKKWLSIDFNAKIKLDIFSHYEENLFIDLLIYQENWIKIKVKESLWDIIILQNYLDVDIEQLKKDLKFKNLDVKNEMIFDISDEKKRKYMEEKFDYIEKKYHGDINIEYIKKSFPYLWEWNDNFEIKWLFFQEKEKKYKMTIYPIEIENIDELKWKLLLFPLLFPEVKNNTVHFIVKTFKIQDFSSQIVDENEKLQILDIFKKCIIIEKKPTQSDILNLFSKTNLFFDYRLITKNMFDKFLSHK